MYSILLVIIYISFISLGLPDSLLGSAWPSMHAGLGVPVSYAGILSMIIAGGTILSSLFSDKLIHRIGTGKVTAVSVFMTAAALFGFSVSKEFWMLCLWAVPYGLGAGSVDAALNNFVALNYKARHMSWLHCFWGIGATLGPYIMGFCLVGGSGWNGGYRAIAVIQIVLTGILIVGLPLWRGEKEESDQPKPEMKSLSIKEALDLPGAKAALTAFFCYCSMETTTGLWASSYMVMNNGMSAEMAAQWAALFYLGITAGRFLCGLITMRLGDQWMIRIGQMTAAAGIILLILQPGTMGVCIGLILIGLGCAPIYPSLLHETPYNFGASVSQSLMGLQMACAYIGSTFMPPLFGLLAEKVNIKLFPYYLAVFVVLMIVMVERVNRLPHGRDMTMEEIYND